MAVSHRSLKPSHKLDFDQNLQRIPGRLRIREPLSQHTSLRMGGDAVFWFEPQDEKALGQTIRLCGEHHIPWRVLGGGSNCLIPESGYPGVVIHFKSPYYETCYYKGDDIVVRAGLRLGQLIANLLTQGRGDFEFLLGIPAQVGGALQMNAGSQDRCIGMYVESIVGLDAKGRRKELKREEIPFSYRDSGLKSIVITEARLKFPKIPQEITIRRMKEYDQYRKSTQDLRFPNAGCMFRNPISGLSAGALIDQVGLKGKQYGKAQISNRHANFILNLGQAKFKDILHLMDTAQEEVRKRLGVELTREIQVWE